ncbi:MAG: MOSC domain-containing protein [Caldimicrobium sp.]|nr:MOSC domain-containing protein [Caldimicrobium sp.]MCX7873543.1 MOSC domain-containing protein [Caldimicrobium sp.]MDW8094072.1 MOSC domain-containing protein [Caldimicrobium sp.]
MKRGKVIALSISREKGVPKENVSQVKVIENYGIEGDAHAGSWHRQVSFLDVYTLEWMKDLIGRPLAYGELAENVTTDLDLSQVKVGDKIIAGECLFEVTQIGKKCHHGCAIFERVGKCEMRNRGVFTKVIKGGIIKVGDIIELIKGRKDEAK